MESLVKVSNLFFAYEQDCVVLENINLDIKTKGFLAIIGPNGGGKSTLLKLMLGVLKPTSGEVLKYEKNESFGYVPQNTNLNLNFPITVLEVVLMGHIGAKRKIFGYEKDEINCAMNSLKQVGMQDYKDIKIGSLSGGQRQRVFIARALCANPKVLFLDEPTASIDVSGQKDVYELLKDLSEKISIVVVSHDISVLLNYAEDVAHINKNIVFHNLENIDKNLQQNDDSHLCEVELLSALGKSNSCSCH